MTLFATSSHTYMLLVIAWCQTHLHLQVLTHPCGHPHSISVTHTHSQLQTRAQTHTSRHAHTKSQSDTHFMIPDICTTIYRSPYIPLQSLTRSAQWVMEGVTLTTYMISIDGETWFDPAVDNYNFILILDTTVADSLLTDLSCMSGGSKYL